MAHKSRGLILAVLIGVLAVWIVFTIFYAKGKTMYPEQQTGSVSMQHGTSLNITTVSNAIVVRVDPTATEITAHLKGTGDSRGKLEIERNGSIVDIRVSYKEKRWFFNWFSWRNLGLGHVLEVIIPTNQLDTLSIKSTSGDISLAQDIFCTSLTVKSTSGEITLASVEAQNSILLDTVSGDIESKDLVGTDITVKTTSGDISFAAAAGTSIYAQTLSGRLFARKVTGRDITLKTTSGNLVFVADSKDGKLFVSSVSGSIDGQLGADTDAQLSASSVSGRIKFKSDSSHGSFSSTLGSGTGTVSAKTTSGNITLIW